MYFSLWKVFPSSMLELFSPDFSFPEKVPVLFFQPTVCTLPWSKEKKIVSGQRSTSEYTLWSPPPPETPHHLMKPAGKASKASKAATPAKNPTPQIRARKAQIKSQIHLLRQKAKRKLSAAASLEGTVDLTNDKVEDRLLCNFLQKIQKILPKCSKYKPAGIKPKKIKHQAKAPYVPLKKQVMWMPLNQQDTSSIGMSLTDELEKFASYVSVSSCMCVLCISRLCICILCMRIL